MALFAWQQLHVKAVWHCCMATATCLSCVVLNAATVTAAWQPSCLFIWQWYNNLNQKNLCHRSAILYGFLHISTKSTNTYHQKHPAAVCSSPSHAQLLNTHQSTSIYQLHTIYTLPVKTIITLQMIPFLQ